MGDAKKLNFEIRLNSIVDSDDPTVKEVEFILHDFSVSHNNALISKDVANKALKTLKNKPIVCKYSPVSDAGTDDDHLAGHEAYLDEDRESGHVFVATNTVPIGVFTDAAYITTITDDNGAEIEVVAGKGLLWSSRFPNPVGLLKEWVDNGVAVFSSMEILYDKYLFEEGIEKILSYVYEGHAILNSEDRGGQGKVYPAYDVSKLTKLVAQAVRQEDFEKEDEKVKFKKVFELSHDNIRSQLYTELSKGLSEDEYNYAWISEVYDDHFIYSEWKENEGSKYYQANYTKENDALTIDLGSKTEVMEKREWVKVEEVKTLQVQLNDVSTKFNEATDKLTALKAELDVLKPIQDKYNTEQFEKALNEKKEFYSAKFEAVNSKDQFDSDEVQTLITASVADNEEGKNAILQLNSMLVDLVQPTTKEGKHVREFSSRQENLIPSGDFDSRYAV